VAEAEAARPEESALHDAAAGEPSREGLAPVGAAKPENGHAGVRCGPGLGHSVGWLLGDPDGKIPPDAPLHSLLLAASRLMGAFHVNMVNQAGVQISPAGLGVLRVLLAGDGLKSSDVAARGWSSPGTLTSVVNTLVREGYVERRSDADDRRIVRLFVTDKGRRVCADYFSAAGPSWRDAFGFVSPEDEPVIRKFFLDMIEQFSELVWKERGK
jgi:DNA-binding MarR family transcriptional regulator